MGGFGSDGRQVYVVELALVEGANVFFGTVGRLEWAESPGRIFRSLGH